MRIEHKLILSTVVNAAFILLIGFFAFQNLSHVLTKLRFVEIADDLNASFLEMRLSEKNYFLYRDPKALEEIQDKIRLTAQSIDAVRGDIVRAIGETDLTSLESYLKRYSNVVEETARGGPAGGDREAQLRAEGRRLKDFSESITNLERRRVNDIIMSSKTILFFSFWVVLVLALGAGHLISRKILKSMKAIEKLAKSISEGNFNTIEGLQTRDELGSVIAAINSMSDELRNREEELIQSKKLASLGILTAGVAHELTNPLNNISMIAQTYDDVYDGLGDSQKKEFMEKIQGETERIRQVVKNLLDFSKPTNANLQEADINAVIRKTMNLVQNMLDVSNIDVSLNLEEGLQHALIDGHQIQQVLVNLVTNSVQAMSSGGKLFIGSRQGRNGDSVEVTVMDTGKGITAEFLPHIFDPFFSTKGEGGTGLGLSVSYGIIKNHKGDIRVESMPGVGTTFTIELPVYTTRGGI